LINERADSTATATRNRERNPDFEPPRLTVIGTVQYLTQGNVGCAPDGSGLQAVSLCN